MILTCPACHTKYVVKDGAIPPQGRQVRCANCKESWFQAPEGEAALDEAVPAAPADPHAVEPGLASTSEDHSAGRIEDDTPQAVHGWQDEIRDEPASAALHDEFPSPGQGLTSDVMAPEESGIAGEPVPDMNAPAPVSEEPAAAEAIEEIAGPPTADDREPDFGAASGDLVEDADYYPVDDPVADAAPRDEDFAIAIPEDDFEEPTGRGRKIAIVLVVLLAIAAAAAWFLAPASLKDRIGLASPGKSPLELMVTTSDRQQLASGNELLAISGRVINPTAEEQAVPPIRAELHNKTSKKLVYSWTIAPPARSLPPGGSASFNSAEVDIPPGGDELTVTLNGSAG